MDLLDNMGYEGNGKRSLDYEEKRILLRNIREGKYSFAKEFADILISKRRVTVTSINNASFKLVDRLKRLNPEKAKELCKIFGSYDWNYWLD
jgi:hypothetical protein